MTENPSQKNESASASSFDEPSAINLIHGDVDDKAASKMKQSPAVNPRTLPDGFNELHPDLASGVVKLKVPKAIFWLFGFFILCGLGYPFPQNVGATLFFAATFVLLYVLARTDKAQMEWRRYATYVFQTQPERSAKVLFHPCWTWTNKGRALDVFVQVVPPETSDDANVPLSLDGGKMSIYVSKPSSLAHLFPPTDEDSGQFTQMQCRVWTDPVDPAVVMIVEIDGNRCWCRRPGFFL